MLIPSRVYSVDKALALRCVAVFLFVFAAVSNASAADLSFSPSSISYTAGKSYTMDVRVTNNSDNINGVSGLVTFPPDLLQVVSLSKSGSIINTWAEDPSFSNSDGTVSFEGVILNPGFSGVSAKVLSITFKAKTSGSATVALKSGSVLANDGNATNVLGTLGKASITITDVQPTQPTPQTATVQNVPETSAPIITSSSYPDSQKWYASKNASFAWNLPSSVTAVRTLYDEKENSTPSKVYDPPINNRSFDLDGEGILYMHVQFKTSNGWGRTAHYKFQVDTTAPTNLQVQLPDGSTTYSPNPAILVTAQDSLSGVDAIEMSIDGGEAVKAPFNASNLYHLPKVGTGKHTASIVAYDRAGNKSQTQTIEYTVQTLAPPQITSYSKVLEGTEPLVVSGKTYPNTQVEVSLTDQHDNILTETTLSNDDGEFTLEWKDVLEKGAYEMRARVLDANGATSDPTDSKLVTVENVALIRVGIFVMNWLSLILILIMGAFCVLGVFWYSLTQFGRFRRKVKRNMAEAENTLRTNVQGLRRDIEEFHTLLLKTQKKRELTKEEQMIMKKFKKRLDTAEKEIEEKLEAIG